MEGLELELLNKPLHTEFIKIIEYKRSMTRLKNLLMENAFPDKKSIDKFVRRIKYLFKKKKRRKKNAIQN